MKKINRISIVALFVLVACEEALVRPLENKSPTLLAPHNNLVTTNTNHIFYWDSVEGASSYQLQIVSPSFDSIATLLVDSSIATNQFRTQLAMGKYQWRVRAKNAGSISKFSESWKLTVQ